MLLSDIRWQTDLLLGSSRAYLLCEDGSEICIMRFEANINYEGEGEGYTITAKRGKVRHYDLDPIEAQAVLYHYKPKFVMRNKSAPETTA